MSMSGFMKGDTALEVYSCLARTDVKDPQSFAAALEVVKTYVRSKIKKGKGKEIAGAGGKLEVLEAKYAHLGYQDIFYLTRLGLSLPPSTLHLPRPTSPCQKQLMRAKYPLPLEYILPAGAASSTTVHTITPSIAESNASNVTSVLAVGSEIDPKDERYVENRRGRPVSTKDLAWSSRPSLNSSSTVNLTGTSEIQSTTSSPIPSRPPLLTLRTVSSTLSLPPHTVVPLDPTIAHPISIPSSDISPHEPRQRDDFDQLTSPSVTRPIPQRFRSGSDRSEESEKSTRSTTIPGGVGGEADVRKLLEARIKALQAALNHLDVDMAQPIPSLPSPVSPTEPVVNTPASRPMFRSTSSASSNASSVIYRRNHLPAATSPPPNIPLPPTPEGARLTPHNSSRRPGSSGNIPSNLGPPSSGMMYRQTSNPTSTHGESLHLQTRVGSIHSPTSRMKKAYMSPPTSPGYDYDNSRRLQTPQTVSSPSVPTSPEMVFDLEPETAQDPFAVIPSARQTTISSGISERRPSGSSGISGVSQLSMTSTASSTAMTTSSSSDSTAASSYYHLNRNNSGNVNTVPNGYINISRIERQNAAAIKASNDLRRIKIESDRLNGRWTPPPSYDSADWTVDSVNGTRPI